MLAVKLLRRLFTSIRRRLLGRRRARRRAKEVDFGQLIRLTLREHTHSSGGKFGQPVTYYYCKVFIGTPRKRFNVQFDLALNDHFVPHKEKLSLASHFKRGYSGRRSATSEKSDQLCKLKHLGAHLAGKSYKDDVRLELYSANKMRSRSMICKSSRKKLMVDSDREIVSDDDEKQKQKQRDNENDDDNRDDSDEISSDEICTADNRRRQVIARDAHNIVALRMRFVAIARDPNNQYFHQRKGIDGFFGLGLMHESSSGCVNFIDILRASGHISSNMFSLSFNHIPTPTTGKNNTKQPRALAPQLELCFGGFERRQFEEPIYWHKSPSKKQWIIKLTSVYLGDDFLGNFKCPRHLALLTSSENEIFGPIEIVQKIYNLLEAKQDESSGLAYVDCRSMAKLPNLRISTKRMTVILEPVDYIRQVDGKCFVAIMPSGKRNHTEWRLGTCFFSKIYSIFNLSKRRIGFANLQNTAPMIESYR